MHSRAYFWKAYCSERVNESQKLLQYAEKNLLSPFFGLFSQIELEKVIFNQIWDFSDCLITCWLPTTSILVLIERIYRYEIKLNYLKNRKFFPVFFCIFGIRIIFLMFWQKKRASYLKYFWSYWLREMCLFKCIAGLISEKPIAVNVLTSPKNSCNMQKRTFILLFRPF